VKFPFLRSIRTHLLILVFISALPALGIIIYSGVDRKNYDIAGARADALRVMQNLAQDHERTMASTRQFLMTLAQLPDVQNRNAPACNKLFKKLHKENPLYSTILAANAEGVVFASAVPVAPFSIRKRNYFPEILRTKEFAVGEYMIGVASGISVLPCAYPVIDSKGRVKGFVVVGLDLERYDRIFKKTNLPEGSALALSDHKHIRLNRYPDSINYIGKPDLPEMIKHMSARPEEGTFTAAGGDGTRRLYAYKRFYLKDSTTPYLFMRVGISEEKALSGVRRNMLINMVLLCFALVSIMVLAWYLGKFLIVQRIHKLLDATKRLRNGDLTIRTGLGHSEDELGQLTEAFDEMAGALERKDLNRMIAEEALRESKDKYRGIFENALEGIYQSTPEGRFISANPAFARMLGYDSPEELIGSVTDIANELYVDPGQRARVVRILDEHCFVQAYEVQLYRKDKSIIWLSINTRAVKDEEGNLLFIEGMAEDITDRKRAEEALRDSEVLYRNLFENHAAVKLIIDPDTGNIVDVNEAAVNYYGWSHERLQQMKIQDINTLSSKEIKAAIEEVRTKKRISFEFRHRRADGSIRDVEVLSSKIEVKGKEFLHSIVHDVTDRKRAEDDLLKTLKQLQEAKDMLVQSEKLAAIGRLSAGVGHEILNPLNIISMRMQFLEMTEKLPDKVKEGFVTMFRQIDRIVKITKDLSQFSRISKHDMIKRDINQLIQHVNALVMPRLRVEQVALETELQPDMPQTPMDPDRIEQVVLNIINNAVDALEGRENKVIRVTSGLTRREGMNYLRIAISDNGMGIPGENIDKLFDPFFTTKEAGKGTGLGLHICYTIIQEHGGRIWAENNAKGGASFFIEFPIEEQEIKT
jgi:PAS domain S-box-containing protein